MKLDCKQMHIVSQLFMAAGKAGHPFDMARLIKDASYAKDTLTQLALYADAGGHEQLQSWVISAMEQLSSASASQPPAAPIVAPVASTPAPAESTQKYIGRLR